jgi:glucoamylase
MTELYYHALLEWERRGGVEVNAINHGFFQQRDPGVALGHVYTGPDFARLRRTLAHDADRFLLTIHAHQNQGALSEQFNRRTGYQQGALHLTWSYASYISALHLKTVSS